MSILKELLNEYDVTVDASDPTKAIKDIKRAARMGQKRASMEDRSKRREQLRAIRKSDSPTKALELQVAQKREQIRNILDRIAAQKKQRQGVMKK